jgi:SAM-dependent methyltransferase
MTTEKTKRRTDYGNWVSRRLIYIPGIIAIIFLVLAFATPVSLIVAIPFLVIFLYFLYAYYKFSPGGGDIQSKIRGFVLNELSWDGNGKALDIGCGNGWLVIKLALKYPGALVTGIDYWNNHWGYTREACEKNAEIEGVAARSTFQMASAAALPFADGSFDAVISNFVFHEVREVQDKRLVIKEALRVVKKGGAFAFQDLFPSKAIYGDINHLLATIKEWGIQDVRFINTSNAAFIPAALRLPFMIGSISIIYGRV